MNGGSARKALATNEATGLNLGATLYRPKQLTSNKPLPLVVWTYPRSYNSLDAAQANNKATDKHPLTTRSVPLYLAMRGYAVLDRVSMPIVRKSKRSFVEQLIENAELAVSAAVETGGVDRNRVGIAGHSFGAFSAVTLLAHSDLFRAGVAMSGAYNRTITPFGFQTERRSLWQAPKHYLHMSPFMRADRIAAPLLLVHGDADNNAGTAPLQSRMLFEALRRQRSTARLVILPFEGPCLPGARISLTQRG